jgi:hypothetical protein
MLPIVLAFALVDARANDRLVLYADDDADGWGDPSDVIYSASRTLVPGYTHRVGDCDDRDARVHPGAPELRNGQDDDCDGLDDRSDPDVLGAATWYADMDGDGYGDPRVRMRSSAPPDGYVFVAGDCNDRNDTVNPGAAERCDNGGDDDCDGEVDECEVSLDDAALIIEGGRTRNFGGGPLTAADMDGDGTGDLVLGSYPYDGVGAVYLVYGPASGEVLVDDAVEISTTPTVDSFGWGIAGGDADGDGFDDLLVGEPYTSPYRTYLFLGPITSDRDVSDADAELTNQSYGYGLHLLVTTDHDGDGDPDVVVGSGGAPDGISGVVYVAPGASIGTLSLHSDATYIYEGDGLFGEAIADLGDVNGDGIDDLALSATFDGRIYVVDGGATPGRYPVRAVATTVIKETIDYYEPNLTAVDYDGDGAMDLIVGDAEARNSTGDLAGGAYAVVAPWADTVDVDDAMATWECPAWVLCSRLGRTLAASDFDGDGQTDVVLGAYSENWGAMFFQWGVASGVVDVGSLPYVTGAFDGADLAPELATLPDWNGDGIPEVATEAFLRSYSDGEIYGLFSGSY